MNNKIRNKKCEIRNEKVANIQYQESSIQHPVSSIEVHPFKPFMPEDAKFLIMGSFPGKIHTLNTPADTDWFYGAKRNTFWKIIEEVYDVELPDKVSKQQLFSKLKMG